MINKICVIYKFAPHYRTNIFTLMDKELKCDFVFGNKYDDIKKMNYDELVNFKKEVENITLFPKSFYYQKGILSLFKGNYSIYLMLGEIYCLSTWIMLIISKFSNKKVYLWSHGWYGRESKIKIIIKKLFFQLADGTFLYGTYARNLMIKNGIDGSKLFIIHNSLSYDNQMILRKNLKSSAVYLDHFKNDYLNLIFIGRLTKVKRLDLLLDAVDLLNKQSINLNLTIVGDGPMKERLRQQAHELRIKNIWFYGPSYNEKELSTLIFNADLCVSPGNVGLTAIHAMTYGTPVITHNNFSYQMPEFEAISDGETGTFFDFNNPASLAENIKKWFAIAPDREKTRQNCYKIIDAKWNPHYQLNVLTKHLR